ncbi:hypothetical protein ANACAC_01533 [Anaerostipes caccae L1-92]|uniref:Uncharacterized protein n=1 Tax=Anaerostipes caccae (strain DSM 14662 / CCUG 47493 / JCM 13470 / NCIMB 13811 / L1-92) TaxID=411490 RepID=B0MD89_ANACD|nr:hypothetical protein ANACAC_01533 [Anaerostipes caccae L1-92]
MWEQLPVTEGIFKEEITKMNAPDIASIVISRRSLLTVFLMEKNPAAKNGRLRTPQAIQNRGGRYPSMMCMALAVRPKPKMTAAANAAVTMIF